MEAATKVDLVISETKAKSKKYQRNKLCSQRSHSSLAESGRKIYNNGHCYPICQNEGDFYKYQIRPDHVTKTDHMIYEHDSSSQKYSRTNKNVFRSASAPTGQFQTNVPDYYSLPIFHNSGNEIDSVRNGEKYKRRVDYKKERTVDLFPKNHQSLLETSSDYLRQKDDNYNSNKSVKLSSRYVNIISYIQKNGEIPLDFIRLESEFNKRPKKLATEVTKSSRSHLHLDGSYEVMGQHLKEGCFKRERKGKHVVDRFNKPSDENNKTMPSPLKEFNRLCHTNSSEWSIRTSINKIKLSFPYINDGLSSVDAENECHVPQMANEPINLNGSSHRNLVCSNKLNNHENSHRKLGYCRENRYENSMKDVKYDGISAVIGNDKNELNSDRKKKDKEPNTKLRKDNTCFDSGKKSGNEYILVQDKIEQSSGINFLNKSTLDWSVSQIDCVDNQSNSFGDVLPCEESNSGLENSGTECLPFHVTKDNQQKGNYQRKEKCLSRKERILPNLTSSPRPPNKPFWERQQKPNFFQEANEIEKIPDKFIQYKYLVVWYREWRKHCSAKDLQKKHSLRKGLKALNQAALKSRLLSESLQERINQLWLKSCLQKWEVKTKIHLRDRLMSALQLWKENAALKKRIRILRQINSRNHLKVSFTKWKLHFQKKQLQSKADLHYRKQLTLKVWCCWCNYNRHRQHLKTMETAARKHHRHKCIQVTFHRFYTIFKSHSISLLHYRHYTIKKVFHLWKRTTTISMAESHHLVLNMMKSCDQLILRRAIAHWLNQLWLVRESHRANQWMLRRFLKKWHRKWHNKTEWHQHVVKTIHSQKKSKILKQWQRNVNCRKNQCISATEHIQKLYLMKLFAKWKNFSQRQKQTRFCLRSQQEKWWKRMKMVCFENWRCFFIKRLQAKLIHQCWSYMCVRKAIKHWKELHHQVALEKFANHYKSVQKNLQLRACFKRWTSTLQKVYEEKEEAKQAEKMLQDKLVHFIFLQWYRMSLNSQTSKPLLLRYHNKLLARVTKSWHQLIIRKHQCSDNSLLVYRSQLSKYFTRWRRLHVVYDCERCIKERKNKLALQQCFSGWKQVINRRQLASHFHRKSLLRRFITWRRRAQQKIRKKILLEAEMRRNVLHQKTFFNQWRWNVKRWKSARSEALINIEKLIKKNQMTGAFDTWRRALSNLLLARDYNNCYQMALVRQILMEWHSYTEKVFTKAVIRLQMSLQMDTWLCGSTELQLLDSSDYESQDGLEVLEEGQPEQLEDGASPGTFMKYNSPNSLQRETGSEQIICDLNSATRKQQLMRKLIIILKNWPQSAVLLQWRQYTEISQYRKLQVELMKEQQRLQITSAHFKLWCHQHSLAKLAQRHRDMKLKYETFSKWKLYQKQRKSKSVLLARASSFYFNHFPRQIFSLWLTKTKKKHYWNNVAAMLEYYTLQEKRLQPIEQQLTDMVNKKTLGIVMKIWQQSFMVNKHYKQFYRNQLMSTYLHQWKKWCKHRRDMMQRCEKFKKRRIQTLAIRTWIHLTKQRMVIADKNHCRMHRLMVLVIGSWHQWADANHQQKIAATHLKKSHNYLLQREVFTAIKEEFQKSKKASHCYQCHLLKKATKCWHRQSSRQVDLKNRACQLISHHKIYTTSRIFFVWKQRFVKRCEDRNNYMELVERKVVVIVRYWRRKAQRTRGEMLKSVLLKRKVRSCFAQWKKHFAALEELQQQLWIFTSWKNRRIQFTILNQWKTALLNNTADRTYQNNWTAKIFNAWKKWSKDSLLRRKNFNNFEAVRQKRQMKASFNYWRTSWRNSQISRKWFCQHLKLRSFEVWWCYVSRENQLRVQLNKLTCSVKRRCLYTSYIRWKDKTVSRTAERTRIQHHADMAKFHFTRRLCLQVFHVWHNEILVSQNIARRQFRLSYKYCQRWKYRVDLISTAIFWNEKQIYKRIWVNWRHTYLREICSMKIVKEFTKQRQIQIFHAWHQLCVCKNRRYDCFPSSILQQLNH